VQSKSEVALDIIWLVIEKRFQCRSQRPPVGSWTCRDYNTVDTYRMTLLETYLPPFKAALDAGVASFMRAFNEISGVPSTSNTDLIRTLLKIHWNFQGFVVSDWQSVQQLEDHGIAADDSQAAEIAVEAGVDMEMVSQCYYYNLEQLVQTGQVSESLVDEAVWRILYQKAQLGLFDDPFRFCNASREQNYTNNPDSRAHGRASGRESVVLLKNSGNLLPLSKSLKVAVIGPLANDSLNMLGPWTVPWDEYAPIVTLWQAMGSVIPSQNLFYSQGCDINSTNTSGFQGAINVAKQADVVVMSMGEASNMSGEDNSRAFLRFPGVQELLIQTIFNATGKPIV